jgi:hypothetical protein
MGDEIPGTGGIRKARFGARGRGKRSGARVIYFYFNSEFPLHLLALYIKNEKIDLSAREKRQLKDMVDATLREMRSRKTA